MSIIYGCRYVPLHTGTTNRPLADLLSFPHGLKADYTFEWQANDVIMGQYTIYNTPESLAEKLPCYYPEYQVTITGDFRLDNRPELFAKLAIAKQQQVNMGDAALVVAAYLKWGQRCYDHLLGSFAFVIWDAKAQTFFCCTDHFNTFGLYYFYNGRQFVFASDPKMVADIIGAPSNINYNKLAALAFPNLKHAFWDETWYPDIYGIPAANTLTIDGNGLRKYKYWTPEIKEPLRFKTEKHYTEAFQELMFRVVGDNLRSAYPVTAHLSGGLDSSSIVAVAAKILEKQNRQLPVFAVVLPDDNDGVLTDERYYIDQFKTFPNVNINYITAPGQGFFSNSAQVIANSNEPMLISRHYLETEFVKKAQDFNSRTTLNGMGGELGPTCYSEGIYAELFLQLKWPRLWREIKQRKKLVGESIIANIRSQIIRPLLPGFFEQRLSGYAPGLHPHTITHFTPQIIDYLQKNAKSVLTDKLVAPVSNFARHRQNHVEVLRMVQNKSRSAARVTEVDARSPFMDVRMLEFCLAAPAEFKLKNGYKRYLIRAGLDGILPPEIQWRNTKNPYSPDYHRRYNQEVPLVRSFLNDIAPNDPVRKVVDVEKLKDWLNIPVKDHERHTMAERISRDYLPAGIFMIQFLRRFEGFQS